MSKISIILPLHNSMPHVFPMIKALYESTNYPFRLIIIEAESTDGTAELVDTLKKDPKYPNVEVYHIKKSTLPYAINYGIKKAGTDDVYITQDDVIHFRLYGRDWLMDYHDYSKRDRTGALTCIRGMGISDESYIKGLKWVGTWAVYIPRKTIDKVGLYDEQMGPGDDIDYSYRIFNNGLKIGVLDFWVQHHRLTEHGDVDTQKKQAKMAKYFRSKWRLDSPHGSRSTNKRKR